MYRLNRFVIKHLNKLFTAGMIWQLVAWFFILIFVFVSFLSILNIVGVKIEWSDLFHSMTSYEHTFKKPLYVFLYLIGVALFSGFLVMILTNGVRNMIERLERGDVRYNFNNHIVFLGYNNIVLGLLSSCFKNSKNNYLILVEKKVSEIRDELHGVLGNRKNLYVLHGSRVSEQDLKNICIPLAKEVYVIGENEKDVDIINIQSLKIISSLNNDKQNRLFFIYNNKDSDFCSLEYYNKFLSPQFLCSNFLEIIDFDDLSINNIISDSDNRWPGFKLHCRNGDSITCESDKRVHLVIFGVNEVSLKLIKAAVNFCHFPNHYTKGINTLITFIDENINDISLPIKTFNKYFDYCKYELKNIQDGKMVSRYNHNMLEDCSFIDIDFEFINAKPTDDMLVNMIDEWAKDENRYLSIYTCFQDFKYNLDLSILLSSKVSNTPLWMYAKTANQISILFEDIYPNIVPWGNCWAKTCGVWNRERAAELCNCIDRNKEISSREYYNYCLDFVSYLSILHTSKSPTNHCIVPSAATEYYRHCARSLFMGEDKILNLFGRGENKDCLLSNIVNYDNLDDGYKKYYEKLVMEGYDLFRGYPIRKRKK